MVIGSGDYLQGNHHHTKSCSDWCGGSNCTPQLVINTEGHAPARSPVALESDSCPNLHQQSQQNECVWGMSASEGDGGCKSHCQIQNCMWGWDSTITGCVYVSVPHGGMDQGLLSHHCRPWCVGDGVLGTSVTDDGGDCGHGQTLSWVWGLGSAVADLPVWYCGKESLLLPCAGGLRSRELSADPWELVGLGVPLMLCAMSCEFKGSGSPWH